MQVLILCVLTALPGWSSWKSPGPAAEISCFVACAGCKFSRSENSAIQADQLVIKHKLQDTEKA